MKRFKIKIYERNGSAHVIPEGLPLRACSPTEDLAEAYEKLHETFRQPSVVYFTDPEGSFCILHTDDIRGARFSVVETDEPEPEIEPEATES